MRNKLVKKRTSKAGLPPGTLVHIGERHREAARVSIIATLFMLLTFIAGLYGMNFRYKPELNRHLGYPAVLLLMLVVAGGMLNFSRGKNWI